MPRKIQDLALQDRPREKLRRKGTRVLSDFELMEVLIGSGGRTACVGQIALALQRLVRKVGPDGLTWELLQRVPGLSTAKISRLLATLELVRRYRAPESRRVERAEDVLPLVAHIRDKKQEHLLAITLDGARCILQTRTVTIGTLTSSLIHPREVFADAIAERAASIILVHNHPSGILEPSTEDLATTKQLVEAGQLLGIPVRDHLIVTKRGYCSMAVRGLL